MEAKKVLYSASLLLVLVCRQGTKRKTAFKGQNRGGGSSEGLHNALLNVTVTVS
jgi:hypothetical protein